MRNLKRSVDGREYHGMSKTPEYNVWNHIHARCTNPNAKGFERYGGRGIRVCEGLNLFSFFFEMVGNRPSSEHQIERVNNNGHYSCGKCVECLANNWPFNLKWATRIEQARNRRDSRLVTLDGKTKTLAEWCEVKGIDPHLILNRVDRYGWDCEKAFATPIDEQRQRRPLVDRFDEILAMHNEGKSCYAIAKLLGVGHHSVKNLLRRRGASVRTEEQQRQTSREVGGVRKNQFDGKPFFHSEELQSHLIDDYLSGEKMDALSIKYGISRPTIRKFLQKQGVEMRTRSEWMKRKN